MPNVQVSIYLTDKEFNRYAKHKEEINAVTRALFKAEVEKVK